MDHADEAAIPPHEERWDPLSPTEAAALLAGSSVSWWIAGGWAIDLFLGRQTRHHGDLDVVVLRGDEHALRDQLRGWELYACDPPGRLRAFPRNERLPVAVHDIWCRPSPHSAFRLQLMLMEKEGERWWFRRDRRVGGPLGSLGMMSSAGIPILRPEIQLLFKATGTMRDKDHADFEATRPHLTPDAAGWLRAVLTLVAPGHPWLGRI